MPRNGSLDNAKGIAILAVVIGHVLRGYRSAGLLPDSFPLLFTDALLYGFHVQVFFVIAGFLTFPKAGSFTFQAERQLNLYYPYLLWSAISWAVTYALSGQVNTPMTTSDLLWIPVIPIQHFWFLLILMIGTALLGLLRTQVTLCIVFAGLTVLTFFPDLSWFGIKMSLLFMLTGALLRAGPGLPAPHLGLGMAGLALLIGQAWLRSAAAVHIWPPILFLAQLGGCYAAYAGADLLRRQAVLNGIFSYLGKHSLAIYLLHVFGSAGARIILRALMPGLDPLFGVMAGLLCAILFPLVFEQMAARLNLARSLGLRPLVEAKKHRIEAAALT